MLQEKPCLVLRGNILLQKRMTSFKRKLYHTLAPSGNCKFYRLLDGLILLHDRAQFQENYHGCKGF
jgi:hypothetical protein